MLIGEAASQTYDGVLGVCLSKPRNTTGKGRSMVEIVTWNGRRSTDILAALRAVDYSFSPEFETNSSYSSSNGVRVTVTSLDRADHATSKRIGYLIGDSVRAVVLHGPGILVTVPAPERLAVHALIELAADAALFLEALALAGRQHVLVGALATALRSRLISNARLAEGLSQLPPDLVATIEAVM